MSPRDRQWQGRLVHLATEPTALFLVGCDRSEKGDLIDYALAQEAHQTPEAQDAEPSALFLAGCDRPVFADLIDYALAQEEIQTPRLFMAGINTCPLLGVASHAVNARGDDRASAQLFAAGIEDRSTAEVVEASYRSSPRLSAERAEVFLSPQWADRAAEAMQQPSGEARAFLAANFSSGPRTTLRVRTRSTSFIGGMYNGFDRHPSWGEQFPVPDRLDHGAWGRYMARLKRDRGQHFDSAALSYDIEAYVQDIQRYQPQCGYLAWDELDADWREVLEWYRYMHFTLGMNPIPVWRPWDPEMALRYYLRHAPLYRDADGNERRLVAFGGMLAVDERGRRRYSVDARALEIVIPHLERYPELMVHSCGTINPRFLNYFLREDPHDPNYPLLVRLQGDGSLWIHWALQKSLVFMCSGELKVYRGEPMMYADDAPVTWAPSWPRDRPMTRRMIQRGYRSGERMAGWNRKRDGRLRFWSPKETYHGFPWPMVSVGLIRTYDLFWHQTCLHAHAGPYPEDVQQAVERLVTHRQLRLL